MNTNRYTQFKSTTYNPLTLEELMLVPKMKAEAAGAAEDYLGKLEALGNYQLGYINDSAGANAIGEYRNKLSTDISGLRERLLNNPNNVSSVLTDANSINRGLIKEMSPDGLFGVNKSQYGAALENMKQLQALYQAGKISPEVMNASMNKALGDYRNQNDPNAIYKAYNPSNTVSLPDKAIKVGQLVKEQKFTNFLDLNFDKLLQDPQFVKTLQTKGVNLSDYGKAKLSGNSEYLKQIQNNIMVKFTPEEKIRMQVEYYLKQDPETRAYLNDISTLNLGNPENMIQDASNFAAQTLGGINEVAYNQEQSIHMKPKEGNGSGNKTNGPLNPTTRDSGVVNTPVDYTPIVNSAVDAIKSNNRPTIQTYKPLAITALNNIYTRTPQLKKINNNGDYILNPKYKEQYSTELQRQEILKSAYNTYQNNIEYYNSSGGSPGQMSTLSGALSRIQYDKKTGKYSVLYDDKTQDSEVFSTILKVGTSYNPAEQETKKNIDALQQHINGIEKIQKDFGFTLDQAANEYKTSLDNKHNIATKDLDFRYNKESKDNITTEVNIVKDSEHILKYNEDSKQYEPILKSKSELASDLKPENKRDIQNVGISKDGDLIIRVNGGGQYAIPLIAKQVGGKSIAIGGNDSARKFGKEVNSFYKNLYSPELTTASSAGTLSDGKKHSFRFNPNAAIIDEGTGVVIIPVFYSENGKIVNDIAAMVKTQNGYQLISETPYARNESYSKYINSNGTSTFSEGQITNLITDIGTIVFGIKSETKQEPTEI